MAVPAMYRKKNVKGKPKCMGNLQLSVYKSWAWKQNLSVYES